MQMSPAIWIIGPFLYIIFVAIIFALLYLCIKLGVKHGMLAAYEEPFAQRRITLSADIQSHILMRAHREAFLQMVSILLDNAVKYTPEGGTVWFSMKQAHAALDFRR